MNQIQKQSQNIFYYINKLPIDLVNEIKKYIPNKNLFFVNREKYIANHYLIRDLIPKKNFERYIRNIVYLDFDFVFIQIVQENYLKWFEIKQYLYKNIIYKNYIYFIKDFCIENNSEKCRIMLNFFLEKLGLCKNQHKKNINKHIIWKT
jgi:subtilase family serine protease